jgi:hypothetical protein
MGDVFLHSDPTSVQTVMGLSSQPDKLISQKKNLHKKDVIKHIFGTARVKAPWFSA